MSTTPESIAILTVVAAFFSVFRFAVDVISSATKYADKETENVESDTAKKRGSFRFSLRFSFNASSGEATNVRDTNTKANNSSTGANASLSTDALIEEGGAEGDEPQVPLVEKTLSNVSFLIQSIFFVYFLTMTVLTAQNQIQNILFDALPLAALTVGSFFSLVTSARDYQRKQFSTIQRLFYILFTLISALGLILFLALSSSSTATNTFDYITMSIMISYAVLAFMESKLFVHFASLHANDNSDESKKKKHLGRSLFIILKPYFWPKATVKSSAFMNRFRAIMTWVCVLSSKGCTVVSPIFLGRASTALTRLDYGTTARNAAIYCCIQFAATFFKEGQSLFYLRVAQAAFIQLSEISFQHIHSLSLDWHMRKKLGEVIRSMDRGILSCDTLMKYLFLWLIPAIAECILVCIIFAVYFDYLPLAFSIFTFVFVYMVSI